MNEALVNEATADVQRAYILLDGLVANSSFLPRVRRKLDEILGELGQAAEKLEAAIK